MRHMSSKQLLIGVLTTYMWKQKLHELTIQCIYVVSQPAWAHDWQSHTSNCWGQVITLCYSRTHRINGGMTTRNRQDTVAWRCTGEDTNAGTGIYQWQSLFHTMRHWHHQNHNMGQREQSFCQKGEKELTDQAVDDTQETTAACGSCLIPARAGSGLLHRAGWLLPLAQRRGGCQTVLVSRKQGALASRACSFCGCHGPAERGAELSPSCKSPMGHCALPFRQKGGFLGFKLEQTMQHKHNCFPPPASHIAGGWWWLSCGSESSCHSVVLLPHLPSLTLTGSLCRQEQWGGDGLLVCSDCRFLCCAAVAAASLPPWVSYLWGWSCRCLAELRRATETLGNAKREVLCHLFRWAEQASNTLPVRNLRFYKARPYRSSLSPSFSWQDPSSGSCCPHSSCFYVKELSLSQQHVFHWLYQHKINPLKQTVAAWISPVVPDLVLHRSVSQVFDIYPVMQAQDLTQYSESLEETSKEQPIFFVFKLGLNKHSLLLSQDLKYDLTN